MRKVQLMENQAVELIGLKQQAAGLLYGEETGGLSTLKSAGGGSLLAELAAEMGADKTIADLGTLFARHAQASDPTESAWFTAETSDEPMLETAPEPIHQELASDPLLSFVSEELGGMVIDVALNAPAPQMPIRLAPLPPRPKTVRRRKVNLLDAPPDDPIPALELLAGLPTKTPRLSVPFTPPPTDVRQLALF